MRAWRADSAAALAATAGRWDDPEVALAGGRKRESVDGAVDPDRAGGRAPASIERSWISATALSITLPISGRVAAERRARSAEHKEALLAAAEAEWRVLLALHEAWIRWEAATARLHLLDEHLELLEQFTAIAGALSEAGELEPGGARLFAIEQAQKKALRDRTQLECTGLRAEILQQMGLVPGSPVSLLPDWTNPTPMNPTGTEQAWVLHHPSTARVRAAYAAAEARLRVELRKQYPDITFSPSYEDEGSESALVLGLGFPVPVWNANRPGIARARAERDIARARAEAMLESLLGAQAQAVARQEGARLRRERLATEAAQLVDRQMAEAQALLRIGEADAGLLFQALAQAFAIKLELLEASEEERLAAAKAAALVAPVSTWNTDQAGQP